MSLQTLPPEIQSRIFSCLVTNDGPSHIHAVLKTCKQLYDVALPFSVQSFRNTSSSDPDTSGQVSSARNIQFLRYILVTRPELAKNIKTLIFGHFESSDAEEEEEDQGSTLEDERNEQDDGGSEQAGEESEQEDGGIELADEGSENDDEGRELNEEVSDPEDDESRQRDENEIGGEEMDSKTDERATEHEMAIFKQRINDVITPETVDDHENVKKTWMSDLEENCTDAQVALILLVCPNIERLYFAEPDNPKSFLRLIRLASDTRNDQLGILSNLREVYHESEDDSYGYLMAYKHAIPFFRLPAVRSYECVLANGSDEFGRAFGHVPRRSSSVEEITLYKSFCTALAVNNMFGACKSLRSFEFTPAVSHVEDERMMPRDIMDALLPHAKTLQNLHINLEDDEDKAWTGPHDRIYLGRDLRRMVALKRLVVGMQSLTGFLDGQPDNVWGDSPPEEVEGAPRIVECIPDNLEYLEIHGCGKAILDQASELLGAIESGTRFKNLQRVRVLFNSEKINHAEVRLSCGSPNVALDVVFQSRHNRIYDVSQRFYTEDRDASNICSRIFAEDLREQWLQIRGGNIGSATVNRGVYRAPGIDITLSDDEEDELENEGEGNDNDNDE